MSTCRSSITRSCVRVPVLSVHSTSIAPKFWMDWSRLTTTFFLAMVRAPFARFTVTIIGSISGVRPTAMERPNRSASVQSPLVRPTMKYTAQTMTTMNRIMSQVKERTPLSKLVSSRRSASRSAMAPKSVRVPVFMTTPRAVPLVTLLPRKQAFGNSHALWSLMRPDFGRFFDSHGLSGKRGLAHEEVLCDKQAQVSGDDGTGVQVDDVSGHDVR